MPLRNGRLTPRERLFVKHMASTNDAVYAATKAGLRNPADYGHMIKQKPAIADAVREAARERLRTEGAEVGVDTLIKIAKDEKQPAGARVSAGAHLTKLSGIAVDEATNGKELHEMTSAELASYRLMLEKQREFIDRLASDQATDVTPIAVEIPAKQSAFD